MMHDVADPSDRNHARRPCVVLARRASGNGEDRFPVLRRELPKVNEPRLHWITLPIREVWAGRRAYLEISPRDEMPYPGKLPDASKLNTDGRSGVGVRSSVIFESVNIAPVLPDQPVAFLRYRTVVETDDAGRYATVLPPGAYDVFVTPTITTDLARLQGSLVVNVDGTMAPTDSQ